MWSVGCIFAELVNNEPLITGSSEIEQINKMFRLLGTPNEQVWPGFDSLPHAQSFGFAQFPSRLRESFPLLTRQGMLLMTELLHYDPRRRMRARDAQTHAYFVEAPAPKDATLFPTWPSKNEGVQGAGDQEDEPRRQLGPMGLTWAAT